MSRDCKKYAFATDKCEMVSQYDKDFWLQFSTSDKGFEIKQVGSNQVIPVQLDNLERYKETYKPDLLAGPDDQPATLVEVLSHPLFWHDQHQYLVIRDDNDSIHLVRTRV